MARALTDDERAVLADVVLDPDAWWEHAQTANLAVSAETALADKVARWRPAYEAKLAAEGKSYKTRAQRAAS